MLDYYRKLYKEIRKSNFLNKEERLLEIVNAVEVWKKNKNYGSVEVNGNGLCSQCFIKTARLGHWNCEKCSGVLSHSIKTKNLNIKEIQKRLLEMGNSKDWEKETENVFQPIQTDLLSSSQ